MSFQALLFRAAKKLATTLPVNRQWLLAALWAIGHRTQFVFDVLIVLWLSTIQVMRNSICASKPVVCYGNSLLRRVVLPLMIS